MSPENASFLQDVVASGRCASREAALDVAIRLMREEVEQPGDRAHEALSCDQWCERFEAWARSHRALPQEADDSRENIVSTSFIARPERNDPTGGLPWK
jgi:hypothetical protein